MRDSQDSAAAARGGWRGQNGGSIQNGCSAGLAQLVVDRLRDEIADSAVGVGAILLNERKLVGEEIDRRAHQSGARGIAPPSTLEFGIFGDTARFRRLYVRSVMCLRNWTRCRHVIFYPRGRYTWQLTNL
jgi:hypothetical protein